MGPAIEAGLTLPFGAAKAYMRQLLTSPYTNTTVTMPIALAPIAAETSNSSFGCERIESRINATAAIRAAVQTTMNPK
jgi:hypothetical protein